MKVGKLVINGHYKQQRVTGVQRYANEVVAQFKKDDLHFGWVEPPQSLSSDALRQLWMQAVMPAKIPNDKLLWSPTNIGPVMCENQVLTLHDIADQVHPEWFDSKYVQWRKLILPRLLSRVRRVITVSDYSRQSIVAHFPSADGKIDVVYNGVQTDVFYPRPRQEINQVRAAHNLNKPFILTVGSLDKRKNIHGLIKAWKQLPEQIRSEYELVITGETAQKFAFKLDESFPASVRFTGYLNDDHLPALYTAATVFAYPSLFEGFGLPVLEAMACGTAVVTSNSTSLKELADGKALLVDPRDCKAITEALHTMITSDELRQTYTQKGQEYAAGFTWKRAADETRKILEDCVI